MHDSVLFQSAGSREPDLHKLYNAYKVWSFNPQARESLILAQDKADAADMAFQSAGSREPDRTDARGKGAYQCFNPQARESLISL